VSAAGEDVRFDGLMVHVARPAATTDRAVLLYPTIMGVDEPMRRFAAEFAAVGLLAVVWDPYDGAEVGGGPQVMLPRSKEREDREVLADLDRVVTYMEAELGADSIAAIGWCFGGRIALLHAGRDQRVRPVCAYNPTIYSTTPLEVPGIGPISRADFAGQTLDELEISRAIRGPVQVSRPERDFTQGPEYEALFAALCARPDQTIYEFHPGATHGFSYTPGEANERAHRLAWAVTLALFGTGL
jgi:carboxymethylenebutenolidase